MTSDGRSYTRNYLNPFITTVKFWAPWKYQKTFGFLVFSGEAKRSIGKIGVKKNERNLTERKERTPKTNKQPGRPPTRYLFVQSQQWKHQNNARNLFKVNNKDTRTTSTDVIVLVFPLLLWTSKCRLGLDARKICTNDN